MRLLAIDTSGQAACVALIEDEKLLAEYIINYKMTHSQTIMPMIEDIFKRTEFSMDELDYIAVASGPGSFTGLRIGGATAKGLAYGLAIKIVPVPTLDALAYNIFETTNIICPIMDARRNQVYTAFYKWVDGTFTRITDIDALSIEEVVERAKNYNEKIIFLGDGVPVHREKLEDVKGFIIAPVSCNMQRGASVAALARVLIEEEKAIDGKDFAPFYIRKSQAERELNEKNARLNACLDENLLGGKGND